MNHYLVDNTWVHIVSNEQIDAEEEDRLLEAYQILCWQYGAHSNLCVQIGGEDGEETEKGVFVLNLAEHLSNCPSDIDMKDIYLMTNNLYLQFAFLFQNDGLNIKSVLMNMSETDGLVYAHSR